MFVSFLFIDRFNLPSAFELITFYSVKTSSKNKFKDYKNLNNIIDLAAGFFTIFFSFINFFPSF